MRGTEPQFHTTLQGTWGGKAHPHTPTSTHAHTYARTHTHSHVETTHICTHTQITPTVIHTLTIHTCTMHHAPRTMHHACTAPTRGWEASSLTSDTAWMCPLLIQSPLPHPPPRRLPRPQRLLLVTCLWGPTKRPISESTWGPAEGQLPSTWHAAPQPQHTSVHAPRFLQA